MQVSAKVKRRRFTAQYKLEIVRQADACKASGEIGAQLRREGLFSSQLVDWRRARERGELLAPKKRGRKAKVVDERNRKIAELEKQLHKATARAEHAEALVALQKERRSCLWFEKLVYD
ncbi:MAG: transposase [Deltaproteobacteria bacterium]|nr:transposase [Deltaproteobacteria bacterium]